MLFGKNHHVRIGKFFVVVNEIQLIMIKTFGQPETQLLYFGIIERMIAMPLGLIKTIVFSLIFRHDFKRHFVWAEFRQLITDLFNLLLIFGFQNVYPIKFYDIPAGVNEMKRTKHHYFDRDFWFRFALDFNPIRVPESQYYTSRHPNNYLSPFNCF